MIVMNRNLAFAIGQDAANLQMRKAGRKRWNLEDYNLAASTTYKAFPPCQEGFADVCECKRCLVVAA